MAAPTETEAIAHAITAFGGLPTASVIAVSIVTLFSVQAWRQKANRRTSDEMLVDILKESLADGTQQAATHQAAIIKLTEAVVDLRLGVAAQTSIMGNLITAVSRMGADIADAKDKCEVCQYRK